MARAYSISTGNVALVAATAKTLIELPTSANSGLDVVGFDFTFDATTAGSVVVEWGTFTTTGTGTAFTPTQYNAAALVGNGGVASLVTGAKINDSVEPSGFAASGLPSIVIPLPNLLPYLWPQGRELHQGPSVKRALRFTSTIGCNARINLIFEE